MVFLETVLAIINKKNISKNKMLTDLNLSKSSFIDWHNRGTIPGGETLIKIADYLDCSVDYLLGRTDNLNSKSITTNVSGSITGNNNNNNIVSSNLGSVVIHNDGQESPLSDEATKLIEIYNTLDVKKRHRLLDLAFTLEDEMKENETSKN